MAEIAPEAITALLSELSTPPVPTLGTTDLNSTEAKGTLFKAVPRSDLADQDEESVLEFFSMRSLGRALTASKWTSEREMQMLQSIASDEDISPRDRMAAAEQIRRNLLQSAELEGKVRENRLSVNDQGRVTATVSSRKLQDSDVSETERLLSAARNTGKMIAAIPVNLEKTDVRDAEAKDVRGGFARRPQDALAFDPNRVVNAEDTDEDGTLPDDEA